MCKSLSKIFHTPQLRVTELNNASTITGKMFTRWTSLDYRILGDYKITASSSFDIWSIMMELGRQIITRQAFTFKMTLLFYTYFISKKHQSLSFKPNWIAGMLTERARYADWCDYHCANTSLFTLSLQETPSRNINNFIKYLRYAIINS